MRKKNTAILSIILMTTLLVACGHSTLATAPVAITITTTNSATVSSNPTAVPTTTKPATTNVAPTVKPTTTSPATTAATTAKPTQNALPGKIAYNTFDTTTGLSEVFIINPDGTGKVKIGQGKSPLFSPDGKQVAFLASLDKNGPSGFNQVGIYTTNLDGSNKKLYCSGDGKSNIDLVRWSPRSRYIIMNGTHRGPGTLFFCNLADGKYTSVLGGKPGAASNVFDWTPDGENALWQAGENSTDYNLYYGDPDKGGKDAIQLTNGQNRYKDDLANSYYFYARFSPDGKTIAVGSTKIFFISPPGQKSPLEGKEIGGIGNYLTGLAWSPDGKAIAYSDWERKAVKIVDLATDKVTTLEGTGILGDWTRQ